MDSLPPNSPYTIYALIDPRDQSVRYIGLTNDVYMRFWQHILRDSSNPGKDSWINELKVVQQVVIMKTLEQVETVEQAREREVFWIGHYTALGENLLNILIVQSPYQLFSPVSQPVSHRDASRRETYKLQYRRCNKPTCTTCRGKKGHGPYWYAYKRGDDGKMYSRYIGKNAPTHMLAPEQ